MATCANAKLAVPLGARETTDGLPHDDYGPQINVAIWLLTVLAAVFLGLRLYCKRIRWKQLWWDDYVLAAAFVRVSLHPVLGHPTYLMLYLPVGCY